MDIRSASASDSDSRLLTALQWIAVALLAIAALSGVLEPANSVFRFFPNDYNEGWNACWADIAWHGGRLYPPTDSAVANNYPPLSFYIVGAVGHLLGDNIFAGRLIAFASTLLITANMWIWLRLCRFSRDIVRFTATLFAAAFVIYAPDYIAADDPQLLAHALVMSGLTVLWRFEFSQFAMIAASLLMVLGGLTKHLLIPLPIAVTVWIALYRREKMLAWLLTATTTAAVAMALIWLAFGADFFHSLASARTYSKLLAAKGAFRLWRQIPLVLILAAPAVVAAGSNYSDSRLRQPAVLILMYAAIGGVVGVLAAGGEGVDRNAFFDFVIAACLAVGVSLQYFRSRPPFFSRDAGNALLLGALVLICSVSYAVQAAARWPEHWVAIRAAREQEAQIRDLVSTIRAVGHGSTACETLALCYWAGEPFNVDFFNYGQKLEAGRIRESACRRVFSAQTTALVELDYPRVGELSIRLPQDCNDLISRKYVPFKNSPYGTLWRPR